MNDSKRIDYNDVTINKGELEEPRTEPSVVPDRKPSPDSPEGVYSLITGQKIEPRVAR